jgi:hypothetical protein
VESKWRVLKLRKRQVISTTPQSRCLALLQLQGSTKIEPLSSRCSPIYCLSLAGLVTRTLWALILLSFPCAIRFPFNTTAAVRLSIRNVFVARSNPCCSFTTPLASTSETQSGNLEWPIPRTILSPLFLLLETDTLLRTLCRLDISLLLSFAVHRYMPWSRPLLTPLASLVIPPTVAGRQAFPQRSL